MTDKQPKPFHVGTLVLPVDLPSHMLDTPFPVLFCTNEGVVYMDDVINGGVDNEHKRNLVHADDGSPLGEWEPLDPLRHSTHYYVEGPDMPVLPSITINEANAILRGEDEQ